MSRCTRRWALTTSLLWATACGTATSPTTTGATDVDDTASADSVDLADTATPDVAQSDTTSDPSVGLWTAIAIPGDKNVSLHGVWSDGSTRVVAVGTNGTVLTWDGLGWTTATAGKFATLNAVAGSTGAGLTYGVGVGGAVVQASGTGGHVGTVWGPPGACTSPTDCDDADSCTTDICDAGLCQHAASGASGCCGGVAFADAFDKGLGKWTVTDNYAGNPGAGGVVWSAASVYGPDGGLRAFSPPAAAYFGRTDVPCADDPTQKCATYDNGQSVGAVMTSQAFTVPPAASAALTFQLYLDVESGFFDAIQISVLDAAGGKTQLLDKQDVWPSGSTDGKWVPQTLDLTPFAGQKIQLQFRFESYSSTNNSGQGVFLDDLVVSTQCAAGTQAGKGLTTKTLFGAWAFADNDAWAVGEDGTLAHFDGTAWGLLAGGVTARLAGMGGAAGTPILAVGDAGTLGQVTQSGLSPVALPGTTAWHAVAVATSAGAWSACAVGEGGQTLDGSGGGWSVGPTIPGANLTGVTSDTVGGWIASSDVGNLYVRAAGAKAWGQATSVGTAVDGLTHASDGTIVAVGNYGLVATRAPGSSAWVTSYGELNGQNIHAVTALDAKNVWVAGDAGSVSHWDGTAWGAVAVPTTATLHAVWAADTSHVYAVGSQGAIVRWNGVKWQKMVSGSAQELWAVWGNGPDDVFAAGAGGQLLHWDGVDTAKLKWTVVGTHLDGSMRAVWGLTPDDLWIAGEKGLIYHYDGTAWAQTKIADYQPDESAKPRKITATLLAIWGTSWDNVWAAGEPDAQGRGTLVHWDGTGWTYDPTLELESRPVRALWGWGPDRILMAGTQGMVLRFDGQGGVQELHPDTIATIFGVAGYGKDALLVGDLGTVLRWTPLD